MIKPIEKYIFTFPKDEQGNDIKFRFMLTLSKTIKSVEKDLFEAIGTLSGIDGIAQGGKYTMEIVIARTFDPDEIIDILKKRLDVLLSDLLIA